MSEKVKECIHLSSVAAALVVTLVMQPVLAQDQSGNHGSAETGASPAADVKKNNVDTGIPIEPPSLKAHARPGAPQKSFTIAPPERRPAGPASRATQPMIVHRNAIGMPVIQSYKPQPLGPPSSPRPAPAAAQSAADQSLGAANRSRGGVRPLGPPSSPLLPNLSRGTLDGSSFARRATSSSALGGPAKPAGGINGTSVRPKP